MKMKKILTVLSLVLLSSLPAYAQDHSDVVRIVRADLVRRGVIPPGIANPDNTAPCKVFEITKRVAWALRHEGAGLLEKKTGNNCAGYSMDWVVYPDGRGSDIAVGGVWEGVPTDTVPNWNIEVVEDHARRWMRAIDPGDAEGPPSDDPPPPTPPTGSSQLDRIEQKLDQLGRDNERYDKFLGYLDATINKHVKDAADEAAKQEAFRQQVKSEWAWVKPVFKAAAKYGPIIILSGFLGKYMGDKTE